MRRERQKRGGEDGVYIPSRLAHAPALIHHGIIVACVQMRHQKRGWQRLIGGLPAWKQMEIESHGDNKVVCSVCSPRVSFELQIDAHSSTTLSERLLKRFGRVC
ncbi:hypothetical protein K461DRAFT_276530 [Myriangium duriaei CBS 260.36]|uniref:Uncharacterized protein n=1 Tax=Myriangium duriaei CBS 260.36 TaxID=1168546 RepID=A0A9P4J8Z2_9PEZI|nr:hypothetical protein K461DRAFT_276530 [Myriangium duriaei CBS 260.36]